MENKLLEEFQENILDLDFYKDLNENYENIESDKLNENPIEKTKDVSPIPL